MFVDLKARGASHPVVGHDGVGVRVHGIRGELEVGLPRLRLGGAEVRPHALVGWRRDGGDVGEGSALEYGGGASLHMSDLQMEVSLRKQSGGDGSAVDMTAWSLSVEYDRSGDGRGLTLAFGRSAGPSRHDPWSGDPLSAFDPDDAGRPMLRHVGYEAGPAAGPLVPWAEADWDGSGLSSVGTGLRHEFRGGSAGLEFTHAPTGGNEVALRARFRF